jgi:hypothetical protein
LEAATHTRRVAARRRAQPHHLTSSANNPPIEAIPAAGYRRRIAASCQGKNLPNGREAAPGLAAWERTCLPGSSPETHRVTKAPGMIPAPKGAVVITLALLPTTTKEELSLYDYGTFRGIGRPGHEC